MDIVLNLFDDYLGDRLYASLFPAPAELSLPTDGLNLKSRLDYFEDFVAPAPPAPSSPPPAPPAPALTDASSVLASYLSALLPYLSAPSSSFPELNDSSPSPSPFPAFNESSPPFLAAFNDSSSSFVPPPLAAEPTVGGAGWASSLPRDNIWRQSASLYLLTYLGVLVLYFGIAGASYAFLFDKRAKRHPKFLKNQVRREISASLNAFPVLDALMLPWFLFEVRGKSMLYDGFRDSPWGKSSAASVGYIVFGSALFLLFTDLAIYWVHRVLHWPSLYKRFHKPHHKWVIPTPFASHAFHPLDGYAQGLPYHVFVYLVPINKYLFIGLFVVVNLWTVMIHDSDMIVDHPLEEYINGPAHHTLHHMYFTVNYGQYFTWADKYWRSYRVPSKAEDPVLAVLEREAKEAATAKDKAGKLE